MSRLTIHEIALIRTVREFTQAAKCKCDPSVLCWRCLLIDKLKYIEPECTVGGDQPKQRKGQTKGHRQNNDTR